MRSQAQRPNLPQPFLRMPIAAAYVHVPFCERKCHYCDFYSMPASEARRQAFVLALKNEIAEVKKNVQAAGIATEPLRSLYLGGGTPSLLGTELLQSVIQNLSTTFSLAEDCELTLEVNPGTAANLDFAALKAVGFNRVSIGLQSANDEMLELLGRIHRRHDFEATLEAVREAGIDNISCDLIFALPGQSLADFEADLDYVLKLPIRHLSVYSLQLEEGTVFYERYVGREAEYFDEERERLMYKRLCERAEAAGLSQYELSNFARPGFESKHNLRYWQAEPYLAFGPAAASYTGGIRSRTRADLSAYLARYSQAHCTEGKDELNLNLSEDLEEIDGLEAAVEFMILGLRLNRGVSAKQFKMLFGVELWDLFSEAIEKTCRAGLLIRDAEGLKLSVRGRDLANQVFMEFMI